MLNKLTFGLLVCCITLLAGCQPHKMDLHGKWSYRSHVTGDPIIFDFKPNENLEITFSRQNAPTTAVISYAFSGKYQAEPDSLSIQIKEPSADDYMGGLAHFQLDILVPQFLFEKPSPKFNFASSDQFILTSASGEKVVMDRVK